MGRWMSPDWASNAEAVPYSNFSDPQSLNLYSYVRNNPSSRADADGHAPEQGNSNGWWDPTSFFQFVRDSMNGGHRQTGGAALLRSRVADPANYDLMQYVKLDGVTIGRAGFRSLNRAAMLALDSIGAKGAKVEWGGDLFKTNRGPYGYMTAVTQNNPNEVDTDDGLPRGTRIPDGTDLAGFYHNHPPGGRPEEFSGPDASIAQDMGVPSFIETPSNSILRFDPGETSYLDGSQTYLRYHGVNQ